MLENVRAEFSASTAGQAGRITVHNLQIDNQLLTTAQPVVLARAFRVPLEPSASICRDRHSGFWRKTCMQCSYVFQRREYPEFLALWQQPGKGSCRLGRVLTCVTSDAGPGDRDSEPIPHARGALGD